MSLIKKEKSVSQYILKSYYGRIFFEFLVHKNPSDTILVLEGFPSEAEHKKQIEFLYDQGYNVFWPHYPGTYQSEGEFLDKNPVLELSDFIDELKKGEAINLWDMSKINFKTNKLFLFGSSFSGAICGGLANKRKFDGIVLFSPLWDFSDHHKEGNEQDLNHLVLFVKRAYKHLFRFKWDSLSKKIKEFPECDSREYIQGLNSPLLVLHDPQDKTTSIIHTIKIKKSLPKMKLLRHRMGHGMGKVLFQKWGKIEEFLRG